MKRLILLSLLPLTVLADDISWSSDCASTNCGTTIDGSDTVTGVGNITTSADSAHSIYLNSSSSNTINLTGNLITSGDTANGIFLNALSPTNTITLTGDISVSGTNSDGIILFRGVSPNFEMQDNIITMTGNILAEGLRGNGYVIEDAHSTIISHTGNITTIGNSAEAFAIFTGVENVATINGNITTSGTSSHGFALSASTGATFTVNGNITTNDSTAFGIKIYENSDDNVFNINGNLNSPSSGYAIHIDATSDNNTINIKRGTISGKFYNDGLNNTLNFSNLGIAKSYIITTEGATSFTLTDNNKPVIAGSAKSRGVADIDDEGNKLYQRFNPISRATSAQHKNVARGDSRHDAWIDGYYSDSDRTTSLKELNQKTRGLTVGFNVSGDRQLPLDFIINFENTDTGYGQSDQSIDSNSMMVGLSYPQLMQAFNGSLALQFLTGAADNDSAIKVLNNTVSSGQETVNADYTSYYAMVGADWLQPLYQGENIQHDLYLGLDVMHEKINSHSSSSYFYMSDRDITQLTSSMHYGFAFNSDDKKLLLQAKAGIEQTDMLEGEYQYYKVDGTATRFKGDERNTYMTASLGADYKFTDNAKAYFNVQKFDSSDDIDGTSGNVGFVYKF